MGLLGFLIETVENSIKDKRVENTPPLNSMTSMALLFNTSVLIEKIVAAPNKHTWVKLYKVLAVLDKASRLEVLCVLRFDRW